MKYVTVQLSQVFHFLPLRSKYFPQHPLLMSTFKKHYQNLDLCIKYVLLQNIFTTIQEGVFLHLQAGKQMGNLDIPCMNNKVKTTNIWYPSTLLPLTAFIGSYETSLIGNMRVASQRITIYQVSVTFVITLHFGHKSHCIFS